MSIHSPRPKQIRIKLFNFDLGYCSPFPLVGLLHTGRPLPPGPDWAVPFGALAILKVSPWIKGWEWGKVSRDKYSKTVTSKSLTSKEELEKLSESNESKTLRHLPSNFLTQLITQKALMSLLIWSTVKLSTLMAMTLSHQQEVEMHSVTRFKMARNMKYVYEIIL